MPELFAPVIFFLYCTDPLIVKDHKIIDRTELTSFELYKVREASMKCHEDITTIEGYTETHIPKSCNTVSIKIENYNITINCKERKRV